MTLSRAGGNVKICSITRPVDLIEATAIRFRKTLSEVAYQFGELVSGRVPAQFVGALAKCASAAPDTPATRAWVHTVGRLMHDEFQGQQVPAAMTVGHLSADGPYAGRFLELLCWELVGAVCDAVPGLQIDLPAAPPDLLAVGLGGAFAVGHRWPVAAPWTISSDHSPRLVGPEFDAVAYTNGTSWRSNISVSHNGHKIVVPLNTPALVNRDFQEFPFVLSAPYVAMWTRALGLACDVIGQYSPSTLAWVRSLIHCAIPLVCGVDTIGSASREEALGLVFLPATDRLDQLTECLLHEAMHQLLFRLEECGNLFTPETDTKEIYYSPWRTDPRPLRMSLHGAFVFTAVADLYRSEVSPKVFGFHRRECDSLAYYRARQAGEALNVVLRNAGLTRVGQVVVDAILDDLAMILNGIAPISEDKLSVDMMMTSHSELYAAYAR